MRAHASHPAIRTTAATFLALTAFIILLIPSSLLGQTGPGGVDNVANPDMLELWLRADRGVYSDPGCLIPTREGEPVACWADQSGNGHHGVQTIPARRPRLLGNSTALNAQPVLEFDQSFIPTEANPGINRQMRTLIAVIANGRDGGTNYQHILHYGANGFVRAYGLCYTTNPRQTQNSEGNIGNHYWSFGFASTRPPDTSPLILRIQYDGEFDTLYVNGRAQGFRELRLRTTLLDGLRVGSRIRTDEGTEFFFGEIAEVIAFRGLLDPVETEMVENYLSSKYNIPLSASDDRFDGDLSARGDYDHDFAGIGRERDGQVIFADASGMALRSRGFLIDAGDAMVTAHNLPRNRIVTTDLPAEVPARFERIWNIEISDAGPFFDGNADIIFNFERAGVGKRPEANRTYHLLQRAGQSGPFQSIATTTQISGQEVRFFEFDLPSVIEDGAYFTLGMTPDPNDLDVAAEWRAGAASAQGPVRTFALEIRNDSLLTPATELDVASSLPAELFAASWTCLASDGSNCLEQGLGAPGGVVDLAPGGWVLFALQASVLADAGSIELSATVTRPSGDPDPNNNTATLIFEPNAETVDLVADFESGPSRVEIGQQSRYSLEIQNRGPAAASGARVTTTVNTQLADCSWTCTPSGGATCNADVSEDGQLADTVQLPLGSRLLYAGECRVLGPARGLGVVVQSASVTPGPGQTDRHPENNGVRDSRWIDR